MRKTLREDCGLLLSHLTARKYWLALFAVLTVAAASACGSPGVGPNDITPTSTGEVGRGVLPPTPTTVPLFADTGLADPLDTVPETRLTGLVGWLNSEPLDLAQLADDGRVVLLDFWTYTCVNCVRTFPFLRQMYERYEPHGLTVIGVHSPEFDFEKIPANVATAVQAAGLTYPVALDSNKATWQLFGNHFWPTSYLIGADGAVVYRHFGEGGYEDTEAKIREALTVSGADLSGVPSGGDFTTQIAENAYTQTRELYAGYRLGYESTGLFAAQDEFYLGPDRVNQYIDAGLRRHGQFELDGLWLNESNSLASAGVSSYVVFPFLATSVNAVLSRGETPRTVEVELDGEPVPRSHAGADIRFGSDGRSYLDIDESRMYRVIETDEFRLYELKLTTDDEGLRLHNFTFGVFTEGP